MNGSEIESRTAHGSALVRGHRSPDSPPAGRGGSGAAAPPWTPPPGDDTSPTWHAAARPVRMGVPADRESERIDLRQLPRASTPLARPRPSVLALVLPPAVLALAAVAAAYLALIGKSLVLAGICGAVGIVGAGFTGMLTRR